jgi:2-oxoisovalerate dehydrogenase E1 component beta subunit
MISSLRSARPFLLRRHWLPVHPSHSRSGREFSLGTTAAVKTLTATDVVGATSPEYETMNMFTAVNNALHIALQTDASAIVFGQDVAFGGVFRCSQNLRSTFGADRVFNTPLSEVGIAGLAIGYAAAVNGGRAIAEIQFADYIFPALDQICNELAKFRYRSGNQWEAGGVTIRAPYGAVGHGGHYHSQSPEAYLAHTPGLTVVMPRSPVTAKGLLLASIRSPDPVIFLEPKALYRAAVESVPTGDYEIPLRTAEILQRGTDVTVVGWGGHLRVLQAACDMATLEHGISCELIDLQTIVPWDTATVIQSVTKTGKLVVSHEAPLTAGFGAEIVATIQRACFWSLQAPIQRVCGYDTPFPLVHEKLYLPDERKNLQAIVQCVRDAN